MRKPTSQLTSCRGHSLRDARVCPEFDAVPFVMRMINKPRHDLGNRVNSWGSSGSLTLRAQRSKPMANVRFNEDGRAASLLAMTAI